MKTGRFLLWLMPMIFIVSMVMDINIHYPMWMDEYYFYRLSSELPQYSTSVEWMYKDRPALMNTTIDAVKSGFDLKAAATLTYTQPIFAHTPLPTILVWPLVKTLNIMADHRIIPHIEDQPGAMVVTPTSTPADMLQQRAETMTIILRLVPISLFVLSMWLIYKLLERKVGLNAVFFILPVAVATIPIMGVDWFYWDAFMMFFFILTLYLMETHPNSKWQYLTACCMINTKMFVPFYFLIPLVVMGFMQSRRKGILMAATGFSILPFYIVMVVVSKDLFYPFTHFLTGTWITSFIYTHLFQPSDILNFSMISYLIFTLPVFIFFKKYPVYAITLLVGLIYAWGSGLGISHLSTMVYIGALACPLVANELHLATLLRRLLGRKSGVVADV